MGDYGMKISQNGYDVKAATLPQLSFTSSYQSQKFAPTLQGTLTQTITHGTKSTYTIAHGLGYVPIFDAWYKNEVDEWRSCFPVFVIQDTSLIISCTSQNQNYSDATNLVIKIDNFSGSTNYDVPLYYIIYINQF